MDLPSSMGHLQRFTSAMSKCHVRELSNVYEALFKDATYAYPTKGTEFEKDLTRLLGLVERRGIRVYLEDLPAVGKHFDRCLAGGQYNPSGLPLTKRFSGGVVIPKFLRGLYLLVFHESGALKEDYDVQAVFFIRQILFAAKKADYPCSSQKISHEVESFYEVDSSLPEPEQFWQASAPIPDEEDVPYDGYRRSALYTPRVRASDTRERGRLASLLARLDIVSSLVTSWLGPYDPSLWKFRHGPGAISEVTGPSNKYCWKNWSDLLETEFPIADYGYHSYAVWADYSLQTGSGGSEQSEPYSRMVAVPKSFKKPRLIAAEPASHMWCQQNLLNYFEERCSKTWISEFVQFNDQTLNQRLCAEGSRDGRLVTIDLSSASDRVTCHFVGQLFRSNPKLLRALRSTRTRRVRQTLAPRVPEFVNLRKFSTMGNACTFPVETLGFLCIALASVLETRHKRVTLRNVRALRGEVAVFGDDIIIPEDSRELFCKALEILDFKVNSDKSFWTGRFRESCGVDSFGGVTVTPAYWKALYDGGPESLASVVECANNFYKKFLVNTASYLASTLPRFTPVAYERSGCLGLKTRLRSGCNGYRTRYNHDLQRMEAFVLTHRASQRKLPVSDDSALFQYFTESPEPTVKWCSGVAQRPKIRQGFRWVALHDLQLKEI